MDFLDKWYISYLDEEIQVHCQPFINFVRILDNNILYNPINSIKFPRNELIETERILHVG